MGFPAKISVFYWSFILAGILTGWQGVQFVHAQSTENTTLSWKAPTIKVKGRQVVYGDIKGYRVYFRTPTGAYTKDLNYYSVPASTTTINLSDLNLAPGTYYFAVTTLGSYGEESDFSAEVPKHIH